MGEGTGKGCENSLARRYTLDLMTGAESGGDGAGGKSVSGLARTSFACQLEDP